MSDRKQFPDAPGGVQIEATLRNAETEAAMAHARLERDRRLRGGVWADLPNGQAVRLGDYLQPSYEATPTEALMLSSPHLMLIDPQPPWVIGGAEIPRYAWFTYKATGPEMQLVVNRTSTLARAQKLRAVLKEEVDSRSPIAVYDSFELEPAVVWGSNKLYEILDPREAYDRYKAGTDRALRNVVDLQTTVSSEHDSRTPQHATAVTRKDSRQGG